VSPTPPSPTRRRDARLARRAGTHTITTDGYTLTVRDGDSTAELADPAGRVWSRLNLLADVDRVDAVDESYGLDAVRVSEESDGGQDVVDVTLTARSTAWRHKSVRLRCFPSHLELRVRVEGTGTIADVRLLGGRAVLGSGACGTFRSSIGFASVFDPTPTEPVQVVRNASAAVVLGVVGDAAPGRLNAVFSPPPLCLALGREPARHATHVPDGDWLSVAVAADVAAMRFTQLRYQPVDGGFLLELDYDGHTAVDGEFVSPAVVLRPAADPWQALSDYRDDLVRRGFAPAAGGQDTPRWWTEPIFCGWGAQCARAAVAPAPDDGSAAPRAGDLARQDLYDEWLGRLAEHDVVPGTVVIDDRWQAQYGTGEPDPVKWPDLRAWIDARHAAGQRVLLWWKAWDAEGLPVEECVTDPAGTAVGVDPGSPAYLARLERIVSRLLGPDGLDADGFKIDFTQRAPVGRMLRRPGAPADAPWGIAALHAMLGAVHRAAKAAKPDALIVTHTPHPSFADVTDMVRLNDLLERDPAGDPVPVADQLAFRHAVVTRALPGLPVDTDQWPIGDRAGWRSYVAAQGTLGAPALYYAERIDGTREELTADDLALVAASWREYRQRQR
jgi:hypothetical protein